MSFSFIGKAQTRDVCTGQSMIVCSYKPEKEVANPFAVKGPFEQEPGQGTVMVGLKLQHLQNRVQCSSN